MNVNVTDEIEQRKDRLNLIPALQFVEQNLRLYEIAYVRLRGHIYNFCPSMKDVQFTGNPGLLPQILPGDYSRIIPFLPQVFQNLSLLKTVDYRYSQQVPVPIFSEDGTWHGKCEFVRAKDFPRSGDHLGRILIGYSDGNTIYPSALPESIHTNERVRWFYQFHVFLHEFFHSIEFLRRSHDKRKAVRLEYQFGQQFTFSDWWGRWETMFLNKQKPPFPSRYAKTYAEDLNTDIYLNDYDKFTKALAEVICESFVGYILGMVPNDEMSQNFQCHSADAWVLFDRLAHSRISEEK